MKHASLAFVTLLSLATNPLFGVTPAPRLAVTTVDGLPRPLPFPYDETANGLDEVASGRALARRQHKKLLIDLGGN